MPPGALFTCPSKLPQFLLSRAAVLNLDDPTALVETPALFLQVRSPHDGGWVKALGLWDDLVVRRSSDVPSNLNARRGHHHSDWEKQ